MIRFILVLLLVLLPGVSGVRAGASVTGVRVAQHPATTRFVLQLSERVDYRVFSLADPYRIVIDLAGADWALKSEVPLPRGGLISTYRFGRHQSGAMRVVLDVTRPALVARAFMLIPAKASRGASGGTRDFRLAVDLEPVSAKVYAREADRRNRIVWAKSGGGPGNVWGANGRPADPAAPPPKAKRIVVIDPGHGGADPGTIGPRGTREKDVTLKIARAVRGRLEATGRYQVVLTRDGDVALPLRQRIARAREAGGELFLSLHADSIRDRNVRGASVYTLSETSSDKEAAALAARENKADIIAGVDLNREDSDVANILIDLAQRETMNLSARFASILIGEFAGKVILLRRTHRFAGFAVLKAPDVPSVLVELGYLSNRADEMLLRKAKHHAKVTRAILRAVDKYFALTDKLSRN